MIQNRKSDRNANRVSKALRPVMQAMIETMEARQSLSATLSVSKSLMVFNAVQNSSASQTETLTLTNTGNQPLTLGSSAIALGNDPASATQDLARFTRINAGSAPATLAPGASFDLQLSYSANAVTTNSALLDINTNDPAHPTTEVTLRGIGTKGLGGANQPSLATILRAYDIPTIVGIGPNDANASTATVYPNPPDASSQEVSLQRLVKAGTGPVTIDVLASFTASGTKPYTLGTYVPGSPTNRSELFFTPTSESQSTYVQPQGTSSFDPGSSQFGFYFVSNVQVKGRIGYSEDALNTWDTTNNRKFRFFPMKNKDGSVQPNTYIMTSTEWNAPIGYDFTNIVAVVHNVKAAPGAPNGPVLGLQDLNAVPASNTMVFNRIQSPNTSLGDIVHDTGTLQINNTGNQPLIINSYTLSGAWALVTPPTFPVTVAAGSTLNLSIQFKATSQPSVPYNETNSDSYGSGGGVYSGSLVLNSNDPNTPTATVPLKGYWQFHSENLNEPGIQTIVNLMFNWGTNIVNHPRTELTESSSTSGSVPTYYGEETVSGYWAQADSATNITVQQIAQYHTEGNTSVTSWFAQGKSGTLNKLYSTNTDEGQTLFPHIINTTNPAIASFNTTANFGFKVDAEYSDDSLNTFKTGGGHHFRFYALRDASGTLVPNTYIMCMDYSNIPQNFDFQDNVYIVTNIRPVIVNTGLASTLSTGGPPAPTDFTALSSSGVNSLQWAPVTYTNLAGYNIFRATSSAGPYTKINTALVNGITYSDTSAPVGGSSYYLVKAVDSTNGALSLGPVASVLNTGTVVAGNGAPVAAAETVTTAAGTAVTINVLADASDNANGTPLASAVTVTTNPGNGTTSVDPATGIITYTPAAGFTGTDTFQYTVGDTTGAVSAPATVTVNVSAVPVGNPVAANLNLSTTLTNPLVIDVVASATDATATLDPTSVTIIKAPLHGTAVIDPVTGKITYTAAAGYSGADSIQYTIGDNLLSVSPIALISLTVTKSGPVAANISTTASATGSNTINVLSSAVDPGSTLTPSSVLITTAPLHGTATVDTSTGSIIYTPTAGYLGADTLQYTVGDALNLVSAPATLSLNVGVTINARSAKSLTFVDATGNKVTLAITGGGVAQIFFNGTGSAQTIGKGGVGSIVVTGASLSINSISVTGSTITGALLITSKPKTSISLGNITVAGAIGKIVAATSTLTGNINVSGAVTSLQLGSASNANITIGAASATKAGFSITGGHFVNTTVTSAAPIKTIKVIDWTVSEATDSINAPSIASLITTGDFMASIVTTGGLPFSLGTAKIGGAISTQPWSITGTTNSIIVGSVAPGWTGNFSQPVGNFTIKADGFNGTLTAASFGNLQITGDVSGTITAGSVKNARIIGQLSGATVSLTNGVLPKLNSLTKLTVTGETLNSRIVSAGNIGSISTGGISGSSIDAGTAPGVSLPSKTGNFIASATISSFTLTGRASTFSSSNIGAQTIGSLNLGTIVTVNSGAAFGVGAGTIKSLSAALDSGGKLRLSSNVLLTASAINTYITDNNLLLNDFTITPGL